MQKHAWTDGVTQLAYLKVLDTLWNKIFATKKYPVV